MKQLLSCTAFFVCIQMGLAQCPAPVVESWMHLDGLTYQIVFTAPEDAADYELDIIADYSLTNGSLPSLLLETYTGSADPGINIVEITIPTVGLNLTPSYFFSAELSVSCSSENSAINRFYLTNLSLVSQPGFSCGNTLFKPVLPLPDEVGVPFEVYLPISESETIEDMSIFVDIGHNFCGDLAIYLESPQGTVVELVTQNNDLGNSKDLSVVFQDGAPPIENYGGGIGPFGVFQPSEPLSGFTGEQAAGIWKLIVYDLMQLDDGMLAGVCLSINDTPCEANLLGSAFVDLNSNGVYDTDENSLAYPVVFESLGESVLYGNGSGAYQFCMNAGSGNVSVVNAPQYYVSQEIPFDLEPSEFAENVDIPIQPAGDHNDLSVSLYAPLNDRPGLTNTYYLNYSNIGTECIENVLVEVDFDEELNIVSVSDPEMTYGSNSVSLELNDFCPFTSSTVTIELELGAEVMLGEIMVSSAQITIPQNEETPENNFSHFDNEVLGAFDPNDKAVSDTIIGPAFLENGSTLKYLIRFQNTGTYYAENVVIIDTLDADLDLSTFQLAGNSHPVEISFADNIVFFTFNEIYLPDSTTSLEDSQGFVRYEVSPLEGFSFGQSIENSAAIYFDFNEPIITNTVTTFYDVNTATTEFEIRPAVFPNPSSGEAYVNWPTVPGIHQIVIFDSTGRKVREFTASGGTRDAVRLEGLKSGLYLIQFDGVANSSSVRLVKL